MSGSYEIKDLNDTNIGYLYEGKLMTDKTFGHATYGCAPCCAYDDAYLLPDPLSTFVGGGGDFNVWAVDECTGDPKAKGGAYSWSSTSPSVATVNQLGHMTGVSPGSMSASSYISLRREGVRNCPAYAFHPAGPGEVPPIISQDKQLWYFGGIPSPAAFRQGATTVTLTANGATQGTFTWIITKGSLNANATLEGNVTSITKTNVNTVTLTSKAASFAASDSVLITLKYTRAGQSPVSSGLSAIIESPYRLNPVQTSDSGAADCNGTSGTAGYRTLITYDVISHIFGVPVQSAYINESFDITERFDKASDNWPNPVPNGMQTTQLGGTNNRFSDSVCAVDTTGTAIPQPQPPNLGNVLVFYVPQTWYSGSSVPGQGIQVQGDNLTYFQDHGRHAGIF